MKTLSTLLQACAERHSHLCPRQVLGVRMAQLAGDLLELDLPQQEKRLLTIVETDGCAADAVSVATGCSGGRRTLRVEDFGKVAATFVDARLDRAVRIVPQPWARRLAVAYAPATHDHWQAQFVGYQRMPSSLLLAWQWVELIVPIATIVSRPDARAVCHSCHEEIINEREVRRDEVVLCRACAGQAYYRPATYETAPTGWPPLQIAFADADRQDFARGGHEGLVAAGISQAPVGQLSPALPNNILHEECGLSQAVGELQT